MASGIIAAMVVAVALALWVLREGCWEEELEVALALRVLRDGCWEEDLEAALARRVLWVD